MDLFMNFFGWMAIVNIAILIFSVVMITVFKDAVMNMHVRMFGVKKADLPNIYFKYIAQYKILTLVFCVAPYLTFRFAF